MNDDILKSTSSQQVGWQYDQKQATSGSVCSRMMKRIGACTGKVRNTLFEGTSHPILATLLNSIWYRKLQPRPHQIQTLLIPLLQDITSSTGSTCKDESMATIWNAWWKWRLTHMYLCEILLCIQWIFYFYFTGLYILQNPSYCIPTPDVDLLQLCIGMASLSVLLSICLSTHAYKDNYGFLLPGVMCQSSQDRRGAYSRRFRRALNEIHP